MKIAEVVCRNIESVRITRGGLQISLDVDRKGSCVLVLLTRLLSFVFAFNHGRLETPRVNVYRSPGRKVMTIARDNARELASKRNRDQELVQVRQAPNFRSTCRPR